MSSKAETKILVLEHEGIQIHLDTHCYVVSSLRGSQRATGKAVIGTQPTYHLSLLSAARELSDRLLKRRLKGRAEAMQKDVESLLQLVKQHNEDLRETFAIYLKD